MVSELFRISPTFISSVTWAWHWCENRSIIQNRARDNSRNNQRSRTCSCFDEVSITLISTSGSSIYLLNECHVYSSTWLMETLLPWLSSLCGQNRPFRCGKISNSPEWTLGQALTTKDVKTMAGFTHLKFGKVHTKGMYEGGYQLIPTGGYLSLSARATVPEDPDPRQQTKRATCEQCFSVTA